MKMKHFQCAILIRCQVAYLVFFILSDIALLSAGKEDNRKKTPMKKFIV